MTGNFVVLFTPLPSKQLCIQWVTQMTSKSPANHRWCIAATAWWPQTALHYPPDCGTDGARNQPVLRPPTFRQEGRNTKRLLSPGKIWVHRGSRSWPFRLETLPPAQYLVTIERGSESSADRVNQFRNRLMRASLDPKRTVGAAPILPVRNRSSVIPLPLRLVNLLPGSHRRLRLWASRTAIAK